MSLDLWQEGPDALELAVALHRAPARLPELLRGRGALPAGVTELIRLARDSARRALADPADERCEAAMFFLEHVLLARDSDHYRVLGVGRDASAEQIRTHFRMMIGIFHPDRRESAGNDRARHGVRITSAYRVLRNLHERAAYDLCLREGEGGSARGFAEAPMSVVPPHEEDGAAFAQAPLSSLGSRHFPKFVLAGVAVVGALLVTGVYLTRLPHVTPRGGPAAVQQQEGAASEEARAAFAGSSQAPWAAAPARSDPVPAADDRLESGESWASGTAGIPLVPERFDERPAPEQETGASRAAARPTPDEAPGAPPRAHVAPAPEPRQRAIRMAGASTAPPRRGAAAAESAEAAAAMAAQAVHTLPGYGAIGMAQESSTNGSTHGSAAPVATFGVRDAQLLVARFSAAYRHGDIHELMALFSDDARSESGGTIEIRRDYERLFRDSRERHLQIADMRWSVRPDIIRGEGGYLARVWRGDGDDEVLHTGSLRIEVVRRGEAVRIAGLFHQPAR